MERLLQALRSLYIACFTSLNPQELGTVVLPNSQMRKLRFSHWIYAQFCWLQSSEVFFFFSPFQFAWGLGCSMRDLPYSLQEVGSLVESCELLV